MNGYLRLTEHRIKALRRLVEHAERDTLQAVSDGRLSQKTAQSLMASYRRLLRAATESELTEEAECRKRSKWYLNWTGRITGTYSRRWRCGSGRESCQTTKAT